MRKIILAVAVLVATLLPLVGVQAYSTSGGYRWSGSWPTVGFNTTNMYASSWRNAAASAMSDWNNAGARLTFSVNSGSANTVSNYYDNNSGVLAYTQNSRQYLFWGNITKSVIRINNAQNYNPPYTSGCWYDLRSILRHEFGHTLYLGHVDQGSALMYPTFGCWESRGVATDDRNGIRAVYGTR